MTEKWPNVRTERNTMRRIEFIYGHLLAPISVFVIFFLFIPITFLSVFIAIEMIWSYSFWFVIYERQIDWWPTYSKILFIKHNENVPFTDFHLFLRYIFHEKLWCTSWNCFRFVSQKAEKIRRTGLFHKKEKTHDN